METSELKFIFDIDGTICPIKDQHERYEDLVPYPEMCEKIREYKRAGAVIILFTSRNMNSYHGDMEMIRTRTIPILTKWLEKWDIPYDELIYGKPWPGHYGFYVDDRTVRPSEFLTKTPEELSRICASGRCTSEK